MRACSTVVMAVAVGAVLADGGLSAVAAVRMMRRAVHLGAVGGAIVGLSLLCERAAEGHEVESNDDCQEAHGGSCWVGLGMMLPAGYFRAQLSGKSAFESKSQDWCFRASIIAGMV
jgi:hypothetical protein